MQLVVSRLAWRPRAVVALLGGIATLVFCCLVTWCGFRLFQTAWERNQVLPGIIAWPRWPTYGLIPIGFGLLSLRVLVQILTELQILCGILPPPADTAADIVAFE